MILIGTIFIAVNTIGMVSAAFNYTMNNMFMTLRQFKYLSEPDQEFILNTKAVHIASVAVENERLELFQVDGFYLEIQCFGTTLRVKTVNYFEETKLLEPYLRVINIKELTQLI